MEKSEMNPDWPMTTNIKMQIPSYLRSLHELLQNQRQSQQQEYTLQEPLKIHDIAFKFFISQTKQEFETHFATLKVLSITNCDLRNLEFFPWLRQLQILDIGFNLIQGGFNNLMPCKSLKYVNIESNWVSDWEKLKPFKKIKSIKLIEVCVKENPFWIAAGEKQNVTSVNRSLKQCNVKTLKEPKGLEDGSLSKKKKSDNKKQTGKNGKKRDFFDNGDSAFLRSVSEVSQQVQPEEQQIPNMDRNQSRNSINSNSHRNLPLIIRNSAEQNGPSIVFENGDNTGNSRTISFQSSSMRNDRNRQRLLEPWRVNMRHQRSDRRSNVFGNDFPSQSSQSRSVNPFNLTSINPSSFEQMLMERRRSRYSELQRERNFEDFMRAHEERGRQLRELRSISRSNEQTDLNELMLRRREARREAQRMNIERRIERLSRNMSFQGAGLRSGSEGNGNPNSLENTRIRSMMGSSRPSDSVLENEQQSSSSPANQQNAGDLQDSNTSQEVMDFINDSGAMGGEVNLESDDSDEDDNQNPNQDENNEDDQDSSS